ncbi:MAG: cobalamin-dependent protein [Pseudomonadota bacterium]
MDDRARTTLALVSLYLVENRAVRCLAAFLRQRGRRVVEIYLGDWANNRLDGPTPDDIARLHEVLRAEGVGLVGFSVTASGYEAVAAGLTRAIQRDAGLPVIWGGLHPTSVPEDCLRYADYVCVGEGEEPTLALLQALDAGGAPGEVPGLWRRGPAGVVSGPRRPLVADADDLPDPDYGSPDKVAISHGRILRGDPYVGSPLVALPASLGCPYATCSFCGNTVLRRVLAPDGGFYRLRSPARVIAEIHAARQHFRQVRAVRFEDGVFAFQRAWAREFAPLYRREVGLPFSCMADPRVVDPEWVALMRDAGLTEVFLGIQHTERVSRELYTRPVTNAQIRAAGQALSAAGIRVNYQVVLDDPVSTEQDKRDLLELLLSLPRPCNLFLFSMTVFPKSPLADMLLAQGLITEDDIEGRATRIFQQWRVSFAWPRTPEERFWLALLVLAPKRGVPRALMRRLMDSRRLRRDPRPLLAAAQAMNTVKMPLMALDMLRRGEVDARTLKRWIGRPGSWVTA